VNGFSPISPVLVFMPLKIAVFIVVLLICIFAIHIAPAWSALAAYLVQAVAVTLAAEWFASWALRMGFGA
jgi:hypothetical protein